MARWEWARTASLLAALALVGSNARAQHLSRGNVIALAASSAAIVGDCLSTEAALRADPNNVEENALLGPRPSVGRLTSVCAAGLLVNAVGLGWLFRGRERTYVWGIVAGIEVIHTAHNLFFIGVRTSF